MKNQPTVIPILISTLLLFFSGCSFILDHDSAALEAEALDFVRTLQADSALSAESPVALRVPDTAVPTQEFRDTPTPLPTVAPPPTMTPTELPTRTPEETSTETLIDVPSGTVLGDAAPAPDGNPLPMFSARVVNPDARGDDWRELPIIPSAISETVREIYAFGTDKTARNLRYFSKIGDCQSMPAVFLGEYDPLYITTELQQESLDLLDAVYYFQGFNETSYSVFNGMSAASALTTTWSDPNACLPGESAVRCELRIHRPAFVFVNMGTNWNVGQDPEIFAEYIEEIVVEIIETGAIPILSSKTDNIEGDWALNAIIARTAKKYDVPYFNAWRAIQELPNHGLDIDRNNIYMTTEAWPIRSRAALELLDFLARALNAY